VNRHGAAAVGRLQWAGRSSALAGEADCGDIVAVLPADGHAGADATGGRWLLVIDGLGHGTPAALAARQALAAAEAALADGRCSGDPVALLGLLDAALVGSRGAAVGAAWLAGGRLLHAGVGNTRALRWRAGQALRLPSRYGIVGEGRLAAAPQAVPAAQALDLLPGDWLLLFTDGLDERLSIDVMLPEWQDEPVRLCDHLLARWRNPRDDAAVLAVQVSA
jgi:hypothetical protein